MPGWHNLNRLVAQEFIQSRSEGKDPHAIDALRPELEAAGEDEARLRDIWSRLLALPIRPDFPFVEPSDLRAIRDSRPAAPQRRFEVPDSRDWLFDRLYGAWLGRCIGCSLGKPVESYMESHNGFSSKARIKKYLTDVSPDEYPLSNYFPDSSPAIPAVGALTWNQSTRGKIKFVETDDDICYTVIGQLVLRQHGKTFTTRDVATQWLHTLPYRYTCGGCTMVFRNLVSKGEFHQGTKADLDWNWIATFDNPYREWIGGAIRADPWGYAAPGDPQLAAEFAWRDARMTHVKNGIYGEMFNAAMIAAAFALDDPRAIIRAGLAEVPATSQLFRDVQLAIEVCDRVGCEYARFEEVFDELYKNFGHYGAVHTNNNAALVITSLLLGGNDFEKVVTLSVMAGWDTDCNGATAGSIVGTMVGAKNIPSKWTGPLNDTLRAGLLGYDPIPISTCAERSVDIALAQ